MAKNNRVLLYGGLAAVAIAGFVLTSPPETESSTSATERPASGSRSRTTQETAFNKQDEEATFVRFEGTSPNVFTPLVKKASPGTLGAVGTALLPNQIPPVYVSGKLTWFYTGTAYIDQVPEALVEDTATGQGEYLRVGQTFQNARVVAITPNTLVIEGSAGRTTLRLLEDRPIVEDDELAPFNPLSGAVGSTADTNANVLPDPRTGRPMNADTSNGLLIESE